MDEEKLPQTQPLGRPAGEPRGTAPPGFSPGQVLAGRFRIQRFIARGGMGEVYEALDEILGRRVALKTIRPDVRGDSGTYERFKREVLLASKVTHANVCRIFDIATHREPDGSETSFLTMEILEGETLGQRIHRKGPMRTDEALCIVRQMAAALEAAHAQGIVHRDFKSDNVFLVPLADEAAGDRDRIRVVVTDFGLACRTVARADSTGGATSAAAIVGSPAYMSPEQVRGCRQGEKRPGGARRGRSRQGLRAHRAQGGKLAREGVARDGVDAGRGGG